MGTDATGFQSAFGVNFRSERRFRELHQGIVACGAPVVTLRWEHEIKPLGDLSPSFSNDGGGILSFYVPNVAQYLVSRQCIRILPVSGAGEEEVSLFLFGSAFGALLCLLGFLVLHGSAVRLPGGGAVLLGGASGAGKSTLAMALHRYGHPLMTDDIAAIRFGAFGEPLLYPGLARTKLWGESFRALGMPEYGGERVRPGLDKYSFEVAPWPEPEIIHRVYEIVPRECDGLSMTDIRGLEKVSLLNNLTFRPQVVELSGARENHAKQLCELAQNISAMRILRPQNKATLTTIVSRLDGDWRALGGAK